MLSRLSISPHLAFIFYLNASVVRPLPGTHGAPVRGDPSRSVQASNLDDLQLFRE